MKDWITKLDEEFRSIDDRTMVEYMICYIHDEKKGEAFLKYLKTKIAEEQK